MSNNYASKGFGAVFGGVFGFFFAIAALMVLGIGGCLLMTAGVLSTIPPAVEQARVARERVEQREKAATSGQQNRPNSQGLFEPLPVANPESSESSETVLESADSPSAPEPETKSDSTPLETVPVSEAPAPTAADLAAMQAEAERKARNKLTLAKRYSDQGTQKRILKELIEEFPETEAAQDAQKLIDQLR